MGRKAYFELKTEDITTVLFENFNRYQKVTKCWRKEKDEWVLKDNDYVENWDESNIENLVECLKECLNGGGKVWGAFTSRSKEDGKLIGFASIEGNLFGSKKEYVQLSSIHVSYEYRGFDIGRNLFDLCADSAKKLGAKKLYISGHSSKETQDFYSALGCIDAKEINTELADVQPYDKQLEYKI